MEIILGRHAGFCYGVQRAVELARKTREDLGEPVYTCGPLIHNEQEIRRLEAEGIHPVDTPPPGACVVIRSHGIGRTDREALQGAARIVDATCPNVTRAQELGTQWYDQGRQVLIFGDFSHPEVEALCQWCGPDTRVVRDLSDLRELPVDRKLAILSQTTQDEQRFRALVGILQAMAPDLVVGDTICRATRTRQEEARELASSCDLMIVIGGRHSANTNKLFSIIWETETPVQHIEQASELRKEWFQGIRRVGVTAGASTPDWITKEVVVAMEELKNETVEEKSAELTMADFDLSSSDESFRVGDIMKAVVVQVGTEEVLVDIGAKSEGVVAARELDNIDEIQPGDELELMLVRKRNKEGAPVLSKKEIARRKYKIDRRRQREEMYQKFDELNASMEEKKEFEVEVKEEVKGGVVVDIEGLRGFVPASHLEIGFVNDLSKYVGQKLRVRIIELDKKKNRIVLSQKEILEEERETLRAETWERLEEGAIVEGRVCRTAKFGAFVDLGGIDGLLHISEMGWNKVEKPEDAVNIGETIQVKVLNVDRESEKIALSLKELQPDPWIVASTAHPEGTLVEGKVLRITDFGAFVEIEPGFEGLLHISELAHERVEKVEDIVSPGDTVTVKIIKVNPEEKKIGLSIRATLDKPEQQPRPKARKKVAPRAESSEFQYSTEEEASVTLGDMFGDLFDKKEEE